MHIVISSINIVSLQKFIFSNFQNYLLWKIQFNWSLKEVWFLLSLKEAWDGKCERGVYSIPRLNCKLWYMILHEGKSYTDNHGSMEVRKWRDIFITILKSVNSINPSLVKRIFKSKETRQSYPRPNQVESRTVDLVFISIWLKF